MKAPATISSFNKYPGPLRDGPGPRVASEGGLSAFKALENFGVTDGLFSLDYAIRTISKAMRSRKTSSSKLLKT